MERCGLDLILFNRQGFTSKSCLALQLSVVGASLYCMDMYVCAHHGETSLGPTALLYL